MRKFWLVLFVGFASLIGVIAIPQCSLYDILQLGNATNEGEHNADGFGPEEPTTHGGSWGNIAAEPDPSDHIAKVLWAGNESDHFEERGANFTMTIPKQCGLCRIKANHLKIRWLDGIANDDFIVLWMNPTTKHWELLDVVVSDPNPAEVWKTEDVDLSPIPERYRKAGKSLTFRIVATGSAWQYQTTYGQVAIDYVTLEN